MFEAGDDIEDRLPRVAIFDLRNDFTVALDVCADAAIFDEHIHAVTTGFQ